MSLNEVDCASIYRRWAQFLNQSHQVMKAVHVLLTVGDFHHVLELLHESEHSDLAALLAEALSFVLKTSTFEEFSSAVADDRSDGQFLPIGKLMQSIYLEFGFSLQNLGMTLAAEFYWNKQTGVESNSDRARSPNTDAINLFRIWFFPPKFGNDARC
eukprot:TRINITY_DN1561_c0_g1_i1.p1 TRINITY_DN1561_c0_g1~~TRINITY_DN1561_c0_g1_i1.p1  ORF type:complete len:157 (-),score=33.68 TRINITY_DN1561_c0_g1_i1:85-555(-)